MVIGRAFSSSEYGAVYLSAWPACCDRCVCLHLDDQRKGDDANNTLASAFCMVCRLDNSHAGCKLLPDGSFWGATSARIFVCRLALRLSNNFSQIGIVTAMPIEEIKQLAQMSWQSAPHLCNPNIGCGDYHRVWTTVRWLMHGGAEPFGARIFGSFARKLNRDKVARILVSGGADTGLFALTHRCLDEAGVSAGFVFSDHCATPCMQVMAYCTQHALQLEIHLGDAVELDCVSVDGIVSHNFLLFFDKAERQALFKMWAERLVCGGLLAMVQILRREEADPEPAVWSPPADLDALCLKIQKQARAEGMEEADATSIGEAARRFWSQPFAKEVARPTLAQLSSEMSEFGFELEEALLLEQSKPTGPLAVTRRDTHEKLGLLLRKRPL